MGWWPLWSAYREALESGDEDTLISAGDNVIKFYSDKPMDGDIAGQLYSIYHARLDRLIFENRGNYAAAADNCEKLTEICKYLNSLGNNYDDMITRCRHHLAVLTPKTGVFAVSHTQHNTYGSKYAAPSGAYYGTNANGSYGAAGICSFYIELEGNAAGEFDYLINPMADGKRVILINLNFYNEGDTARAIPNGSFDTKLISDLVYIAGIQSPVLLRIGGEMDVWTNSVTPEEYISAYNYVANMARSIAPNVELVWSPNCNSGWNGDVSCFYPDNSLVDWVGLSLYYDYDSQNPELHWLEASRRGRFADPVYNAESVVNAARVHNKPVIVTEGGAAKNVSQGEAYAARQVAKEFSTLTMVFPEVKAIVCFDKAVPEGDYTLSGSVLAAADAAIASNPTLIKFGDSAGTWVPLNTFSERVSGELVLGAAGRTYRRMEVGAVYNLDGNNIASTAGSPNHCKINADELTVGRHKLEVILSDGFGYSKTHTYTLSKDISGIITFTEGYADAAGTFTDVDENAYYFDALLWSVSNEVTAGTSATVFSPDSACTRGQVVTFLWRAMGRPEPVSAYNPFADVSDTDYFYKPVLWAVEQGIASGTAADTFSPDDSCTNAHIITFLWRTMGKPGNTGSQLWYEDAVNWALVQGLLTGIGREFITGDNCPRADVVTFLYRVLAK
ncbi:MAG: S-layer homology domain-containing protein [Eubacteriales bacterium]|jgi:hypothetical protein